MRADDRSMCADDSVSLCVDDSFVMCANDPLSMCLDDSLSHGRSSNPWIEMRAVRLVTGIYHGAMGMRWGIRMDTSYHFWYLPVSMNDME